MTEKEGPKISQKICSYCGKPIDMDDYRSYLIVQLQEETSVIIYLHALCIDMDEDHWMIRTLEKSSIRNQGV